MRGLGDPAEERRLRGEIDDLRKALKDLLDLNERGAKANGTQYAQASPWGRAWAQALRVYRRTL